MEEQEQPQAGLARKVGCGSCMGLSLVGLIVLIGLSMSASSDMDVRLDALKKDIVAARIQGSTPRPVLLGEPTEGNAVFYYRGLEWAWGADPSLRAAKNPPELPEGTLADRELSEALPFDSGLANELRDHMQGGEPASEEALAMFAHYQRLTHYVRDGLRQTRCDWEYEYERGFSSELPNLLALRQAGEAMAYDAFATKDDTESLQRGMEIMAFGADLQRNPTFIGSMIGIAIDRIGLLSLERTLEQRAGLTAADYQRLLDFLGELPQGSAAEPMDGERISFAVGVLAISGRRVDPSIPISELGLEEPGMLGAQAGSFFFGRELEGFDYFDAKAREICALPISARSEAMVAWEAELEASSYLMVQISMPDMVTAQRHFDEQLLLRHSLRVLTAAHLHRLEHGAFPDALSELEARLGGTLPTDPFHPAVSPLSYVRDGDALRVYSWGENQVDDQGARPGPAVESGDPDLTLRTRVPE